MIRLPTTPTTPPTIHPAESCSRDPIGYGGGGWNLFQYVGSMPLIAIDPSGLETAVAPMPVGPKPPLTFPNSPYPTNIPGARPTVPLKPMGPGPTVSPAVGGACRVVVTRIPHVAVFCGGVIAGKCIADKCELVKTYVDLTYWVCDSDRDPLPIESNLEQCRALRNADYDTRWDW
jgi:hypothetical protein